MSNENETEPQHKQLKHKFTSHLVSHFRWLMGGKHELGPPTKDEIQYI